jgi:hypothetical protein
MRKGEGDKLSKVLALKAMTLSDFVLSSGSLQQWSKERSDGQQHLRALMEAVASSSKS